MLPAAFPCSQPLLRSPGKGDSSVTLGDVGSEAITVSARGARTERHLLTYRLPSDARQGPEVWYLVRLDFRVAFRSTSREGGFAWISAATNGRVCAQVKFRVGPAKQGHRTLTWSSYDLIRGSQSKELIGRRARVHFVNYLQKGGVRGGTNRLTLTLLQTPGTGLAEVRVLPTTGVAATSASPYRLSFEVRPPTSLVRCGDRFTLPFELASRDGRPVKNVAVEVGYDRDALNLVRLTPQRLRVLTGRVEGRAVFQANRIGTQTIDFRVRSSSNRPEIRVRLHVIAAEDSWSQRLRALGDWRVEVGLLALAAVCCAGYLFIHRRRGVRQ